MFEVSALIKQKPDWRGLRINSGHVPLVTAAAFNSTFTVTANDKFNQFKIEQLYLPSNPVLYIFKIFNF